MNGQDIREATHQEAVSALLRPCLELVLLVRRDPPPPGMRELCIQKAPGEKLGISIRGGAKGHAGNPCDPTDEGIFISKVRAPPRPAPPHRVPRGRGTIVDPEVRVSLQVSPTGAAGRDGRLRVGLRLLEVNQQSLLGLTHGEAVRLLRGVGDTLTVLVCDGFDTDAAAPAEVSAHPHQRPATRTGSCLQRSLDVRGVTLCGLGELVFPSLGLGKPSATVSPRGRGLRSRVGQGV